MFNNVVWQQSVLDLISVVDDIEVDSSRPRDDQVRQARNSNIKPNCLLVLLLIEPTFGTTCRSWYILAIKPCGATLLKSVAFLTTHEMDLCTTKLSNSTMQARSRWSCVSGVAVLNLPAACVASMVWLTLKLRNKVRSTEKGEQIHVG